LNKKPDNNPAFFFRPSIQIPRKQYSQILRPNYKKTTRRRDARRSAIRQNYSLRKHKTAAAGFR
jgi:hypothetical protein